MMSCRSRNARDWCFWGPWLVPAACLAAKNHAQTLLSSGIERSLRATVCGDSHDAPRSRAVWLHQAVVGRRDGVRHHSTGTGNGRGVDRRVEPLPLWRTSDQGMLAADAVTMPIARPSALLGLHASLGLCSSISVCGLGCFTLSTLSLPSSTRTRYAHAFQTANEAGRRLRTLRSVGNYPTNGWSLTTAESGGYSVLRLPTLVRIIA